MKTSDKPGEVQPVHQKYFPCHRVCEYCDPTHNEQFRDLAMAAFIKSGTMKAGGVKIKYKNYACSPCALRLGWITLNTDVTTYQDTWEFADVYSDKLASQYTED